MHMFLRYRECLGGVYDIYKKSLGVGISRCWCLPKVYETFSVDEYERRDDQFDPVSAAFEYEFEKLAMNMDAYEVTLDKSKKML